MNKVTRKELVDNVLHPAFKNEDFEDALKEISVRLRVMYLEVYKGYIKAAKETQRKLKDAT